MNYENFLFSQLFIKHIESNKTKYQELEYDLIYPIILEHLDLFLKSKHNVSTKGLYDCVTSYLAEEIKPMGGSLADDEKEKQKKADANCLFDVEQRLEDGEIEINGKVLGAEEVREYMYKNAFEIIKIGREGYNPFDIIGIIEGLGIDTNKVC